MKARLDFRWTELKLTINHLERKTNTVFFTIRLWLTSSTSKCKCPWKSLIYEMMIYRNKFLVWVHKGGWYNNTCNTRHMNINYTCVLEMWECRNKKWFLVGKTFVVYFNLIAYWISWIIFGRNYGWWIDIADERLENLSLQQFYYAFITF